MRFFLILGKFRFAEQNHAVLPKDNKNTVCKTKIDRRFGAGV